LSPLSGLKEIVQDALWSVLGSVVGGCMSGWVKFHEPEFRDKLQTALSEERAHVAEDTRISRRYFFCFLVLVFVLLPGRLGR
jgi:hypothetical protein